MKTKIALVVAMMFSYFICQSQVRIMPMPIITYSSRGHSGVEVNPLAAYLGIMLFIFLWMIIRFFVVMRSEDFKKQSKIKNLFFELNEYKYADPILNAPTISILAINGIALILIMIAFFNYVL